MIKNLRRKKPPQLPNFSQLNDKNIEALAQILTQQIGKQNFERKYASVKNILKLAGAGVFLAASVALPNLPKGLKPLLASGEDYEVWKRFNIPYLKRSLRRLEEEKLVEISEAKGQQIVTITGAGRKRILKYTLEEIIIEKPRFWDGKWRLVSYDLPVNLKNTGTCFRYYLDLWKFYPLHKSVFLHAYPCEKQVDFLRAYLGISEYVRLFLVEKIENDQLFKDFFDL